jgi:SnoaL-like protein
MTDLVETTRDALTRWNAGERDPEAFPLHPEFELVSPMTILNGEPFRGKKGFVAWMTEIDDVWEERQVEPHEFRGEADRVLVLGLFRLRGVGSQALFEQPMGWVFRYENGLVKGIRLFLELEEATADYESGS